MDFEVKEITIQKLIELFESSKLNLNPPYQRNEIWSMASKKLLIDSIKRGYSMPNFFLLEKESGVFEVVDGQQRIRTIINFYNKLFPFHRKDFYDPETFPEFLNYILVMVILKHTSSDEAIEVFYSRVNSTGMKLNRPELKKAEYYDTRLLNLLETLASHEKFSSLELFTEKALLRMNDVDFISELVSLIKNGITEKKVAVDMMFKNDISQEEYDQLHTNFVKVLNVLLRFNEIYPINKTRYKQKNDFYTLFGFIYNNLELSPNVIDYFYKILVVIGENITPSNDDCPPFAEYALHCVSQSNSKNARQQRQKFYHELFLNNTNQINTTQENILEYYNLSEQDMIRLNGFYTISGEKILEIVKEPELF
jgi:Protein of unknown function DUF262